MNRRGSDNVDHGREGPVVRRCWRSRIWIRTVTKKCYDPPASTDFELSEL